MQFFFLHVDGPVTGGGRYLIRLVGWVGGAYKQQFMVCGMCLTLSGGTEKNTWEQPFWSALLPTDATS